MFNSLPAWLNSPAFKLFVIGFLILLLLIPLAMVSDLVRERQRTADRVQRDISSVWGGSQTIEGPYLIVPYKKRVVSNREGKNWVTEHEQRAVFLPEKLTIDGHAKSKRLQRSIYDVTVYAADLNIAGSFAAPDLKKIGVDISSIRWKDAILSFKLTGVSGLKKAGPLFVSEGNSVSLEPSSGISGSSVPGMHIRLQDAGIILRDYDDGKENLSGPIPAFTFKLPLAFNGAQNIFFTPVARKTKVSLTSDWPHPSFAGSFLPKERKVSDSGFEAQWEVPHLARSVPQAFVMKKNHFYPFNNINMGVSFYIPIDYYDLANRAVKYGLLFLTLAFTAVFVLETLAGKKFHAIQYLFVGISMIFFYVLLLSMSEHIGFANAYAIAAGATGLMLSVYVAKAMHSKKRGIIMSVLFFVLYGLLYLILRMEDYALLAGALSGFIMLTSVMFLTLKVNWSGQLAKRTAKSDKAVAT